MPPMDESDDVAVVPKPNWYVVAATLLAISLLIAIVFGRDFRAQGPISDIRIHNSTDQDLQDVVVGTAHYGSIGRGDSSGYQSWARPTATRSSRYLLTGSPCFFSQSTTMGKAR